MTSSAERMRRHRARRAEADIVPVTVQVPAHCAADLVLLAECLRANPSLKVGTLRDTASGRVVALRAGKR